MPYNELPEKCRNKIAKIISDNNYNIDLDKLYIAVLPFIGITEDNRYKEIRRALYEFLGQLKITTNIDSKKVLDIWQKEYFYNGTIPDDTIRITKKKMIWTLIVQICEMDMADEILEDCDIAQIQEIQNNYGSIINIRSEDFELVSKVTGLFAKYKDEIGKSSKDFIKEKYMDFEEEFTDSDLPEDDKKCLIQLIIKKILSNRYHIKKIKEIANL